MTTTRTREEIAESAWEALVEWGKLPSDGRLGVLRAKVEAARRVARALRALLQPPATIETPEQMAETFAADLYNRGTIEVLGGFTLTKAGDGGKRWNVLYGEAYRQGIHAGIQAAWESWEAENVPGLVAEPVDAQRIAGWRADMESGDTDRLIEAFWAMLGHIEEGQAGE